MTPRARYAPSRTDDPPDDDADALLRREAAGREGALVHKGKIVVAKSGKLANAKTKQDALLDPRIDTPAERRGGIRLGGTHAAAVELAAQSGECFENGWIADRCGSGGEVALDFLLQGMLFWHE